MKVLINTFFLISAKYIFLLETEFSLKQNSLVRKQLCTVVLLALKDYSTLKKELWIFCWKKYYNLSQKKGKELKEKNSRRWTLIPLLTGLAQECIKGRKISIFCELKLAIINQNNTWLHRKSYYNSNAILLYSAHKCCSIVTKCTKLTYKILSLKSAPHPFKHT